MRWSVAPRRFTPRHSSTSAGKRKNSPDWIACEMRTMSWGTTRPAPGFRCPTSLLPICPAGRRTVSQEAGGKRLARLARGAQVAGGDARGDWLAVTLEGWIFATSVGPTPRAGFDLAVTRTPEENLRSAPAGALVGKLPQGFLLTKVNDGDADHWVHVTRTGWVQQGDVEAVAQVASSRAAGTDPDTSPASPDPSHVESARRTVLYRAPEGAPTGTLAPSAPLRVLGRSGDWTRVEIDGWVRSGDLQAAPAGVLVGV